MKIDKGLSRLSSTQEKILYDLFTTALQHFVTSCRVDLKGNEAFMNSFGLVVAALTTVTTTITGCTMDQEQLNFVLLQWMASGNMTPYSLLGVDEKNILLKKEDMQ